ncbi:MAG TPA: phospholipase D-like domain-containing protein [Chloroflexota bacterium]|nr:phospholipase D-like domain-containing protein [Chloroflexota bacterium]
MLAGCAIPAATPLSARPPSTTSSAQVTTNLDAAVFVEPDDGPEPLLNELNAARSSIDVEMYLLTDRDVLVALEDAERRGVKVRMLLEEHPYGEGAGNESAYSRLQRDGIAVRWTDDRRYKLTHEKAAVIDRREALILTLNLTASAFSRNREYGVVDRTPDDVAEVASIFEADWSGGTYTPSQPDLVVSPNNSRDKLQAIMGQAATSLEVESEEVQDDGVEQALVAAEKRGVNVRLVLSPAAAGQTDTNAAGVALLKSGGAQVRYMSKPYVHAKIVLADGKTAFVGSENISHQSLDLNREVGLFLSGPAAVSRIASTFEQDWNSHS